MTHKLSSLVPIPLQFTGSWSLQKHPHLGHGSAASLSLKPLNISCHSTRWLDSNIIFLLKKQLLNSSSVSWLWLRDSTGHRSRISIGLPSCTLNHPQTSDHTRALRMQARRSCSSNLFPQTSQGSSSSVDPLFHLCAWAKSHNPQWVTECHRNLKPMLTLMGSLH